MYNETKGAEIAPNRKKKSTFGAILAYFSDIIPRPSVQQSKILIKYVGRGGNMEYSITAYQEERPGRMCMTA